MVFRALMSVVVCAAVAVVLGACSSDADPSPASPLDRQPASEQALLLFRVSDDKGDALPQVAVAIDTFDGERFEGRTNEQGSVWLGGFGNADIKLAVAHRRGMSFVVLDGGLVRASLKEGDAIEIELTTLRPRRSMVGVTGKIFNVGDGASELKITTTPVGTQVHVGRQSYAMTVPAGEPFMLVGLQWKRLADAPPFGLRREFVDWALAYSDALYEPAFLDIDFDAPHADPPESFLETTCPFVNRCVDDWPVRFAEGVITKPPGDLEGGRADLSVHPADRPVYIGGATSITPRRGDTVAYKAEFIARPMMPLETHIWFESSEAVTGVWLPGGPRKGIIDPGFVSPAVPVLPTEGLGVHDPLTWTHPPEETIDLFIVQISNGEREIGRVIVPGHERRAIVPPIPDGDGVQLFGANPQATIVSCVRDQFDSCGAYAHGTPIALTLDP
jgi:hypothetical protein